MFSQVAGIKENPPESVRRVLNCAMSEMNATLDADDTLREEEHGENHARGKDKSGNDRHAVKVLLHDARGRAGVVQRARDHVGNAGSLAGMHKNKADESDGRDRPYDEDNPLKRTHNVLLNLTGRRP